MPIPELRKEWEQYRGSSPCPPDFADFWREQSGKTAAPQKYHMEPVDFKNPATHYYEIHFSGTDGIPLRARYICPAGAQQVPTVFMFHDFNRGIRGWHHMTRFIALSYGVLALENRGSCYDVAAHWQTGPKGGVLSQLYTDALTLAHLALKLPQTNPKALITWGEGLGGGLAIAVAAMLPGAVAKCAALNPLPADFRKVWELDCDSEFYAGIRAWFRSQDPLHVKADEFFLSLGYADAANFAPLIRGQLLMGTGLMDRIAPPAAQYAVFNRADCEKTYLVYPKYEHERINFYENELIKFLRF